MNKFIDPEFEIIEGDLSSLRYLEHGSKSELIRWHCHFEYELHLIASSHGTAFIGDYIGDYEPGYIYLVGPNLPHNWVSNAKENPLHIGKVRDKVINFSKSTFDALYEIMPETREFTTLFEGSSYGLKFDSHDLLVNEPMFDAIRDGIGVQRLIKFFELLNFLLKDKDRKQLSSRNFSLHNQSENMDIVNTALSYIDKRYTQALSLNDVSKYVGMASPSSFSRLFHKATGIKYIEFIKKLRISKACEKLERSNESITNICFSVGFSNVANFNRHFMSLKGMTPRKYRKLSQQKYVNL